jgi:ferredoxin
MSTYLIEVDRSLCSGFGSCLTEGPGIFALDDSGIAVLLRAETDDTSALAAASSCPMGAIAVFEAETGEQAA